MNIHIPSYVAGVLTVPAAVVIFRRPIIRFIGELIADEELDIPFFNLAQARLDYQDEKKRRETEQEDEEN